MLVTECCKHTGTATDNDDDDDDDVLSIEMFYYGSAGDVISSYLEGNKEMVEGREGLREEQTGKGRLCYKEREGEGERGRFDGEGKGKNRG